MRYKLLALTVVLAFSGGIYAAAQHEVGQKNKKFTTEHLSISVGETVSFPNHDPFFHNVFSLSPTATFDLGSYARGDTRTVTFDKPGVIDVECAIHPQMQMKIEVK
jgi:plastocyanin